MTNTNSLPFVSVVIATRNERGYIEKCLESLLNQTYNPAEYEIQVYDALSTDGTKEYLLEMERRHPQIKVFDNPNIVPAAGWNLGFKNTPAKYVVMMGSHSYVDPNFLQRNVEILESEDVPCCGGSVTAIGEDSKSKAIAMAFNHPFGVGNAKYRYSTQKCYVETVNYGAYRKSVVDDPEIGPINEEIKRGEDWEYNYKIVKKYGKMVFSPEIKTFYYARSTFKDLWKRQFDAGLYKLEIVQKYPGSLLFRHLVPFLFAFAIILFLLLALIGYNTYLIFMLGSIYILANLLVSAKISFTNGIKYFPLVSWAFFVMQFAYGLGFLLGIFRILFKSSPAQK
jgi:glycosyltransferase involved in cell wall biosynthesis